MKKITIVWTIILIIIVGGLTIIGFKIKSEKIDNIMESSLVETSKKYLGLYTGEYPKMGNKTVLTNEKLKDFGYDAKLEKGCDGYVVIENSEMGFTYKAYIKCSDYTTKGYKDENQK